MQSPLLEPWQWWHKYSSSATSMMSNCFFKNLSFSLSLRFHQSFPWRAEPTDVFPHQKSVQLELCCPLPQVMDLIVLNDKKQPKTFNMCRACFFLTLCCNWWGERPLAALFVLWKTTTKLLVALVHPSVQVFHIFWWGKPAVQQTTEAPLVFPPWLLMTKGEKKNFACPHITVTVSSVSGQQGPRAPWCSFQRGRGWSYQTAGCSSTRLGSGRRREVTLVDIAIRLN